MITKEIEEKHSDILSRKSLEELFVPEEFEKLLGKVLLFNLKSEWISGRVSAALLNFESDDISVLAIQDFLEGRLITYKLKIEELEDAFKNCEAVIGLTPEESFLIL
jgi:hypothetical protein